MNQILQPGTVVRTKRGDLRTIDRHKPESDSFQFGRAYWFTSKTWDHEDQFTVISTPQPAKELVKLPPAVGKEIRKIQEARVDADHVLMVNVFHMTPRDPDWRETRAIRQWLRGSTGISVREVTERRRKYMSAMIDGFELDKTPREKIVQGIKEGRIRQDQVEFVLETMGHFERLIEGIKKDMDDDAAGCCALV